MIEYVVDDTGRYTFSYQELVDEYEKFVAMPDEEFIKELPAALHFACFASWVKELGVNATIGDGGIVHELAHTLHLGAENNTRSLDSIREQFKAMLMLVR